MASQINIAWVSAMGYQRFFGFGGYSQKRNDKNLLQKKKKKATQKENENNIFSGK